MHPQHLPDMGTAPSELADVRELRVAAREIRPGDFLPPQPALHGTRFRDLGFAVGGSERDVAELAVLSGRMLVFGPHGTLDSLAVDSDVAVLRPVDRCCA